MDLLLRIISCTFFCLLHSFEKKGQFEFSFFLLVYRKNAAAIPKKNKRNPSFKKSDLAAKLFALWRQFSLQKQKRPFKKRQGVTYFSFVLEVCRKV